jgi:uncharacterized membrane protein
MNDPRLFSIVLTLMEGAVMSTLPHFSPRRYFFAVTVAPEFWESEPARAALRRYRWWVVVSMLPGLLLSPMPFVPMLPILGSLAAFLWERGRMRRYAAPMGAVREAEIATDEDTLPGWTALTAVPLLGLAAVAVYLNWHWDEIPARFPIHWGADGQPNGWSSKTFRGVYGPVYFYGARRGPLRAAVLKLLIAVTFVIGLMFGQAALLPLVQLSTIYFLGPAVIFVAGTLIWSFRMAQTQPADETSDEHWRLGSFYYNPDDAAIFVQKRIGFGYTFNFGNRLTWVVLGVFTAGMFGLMFLLPR